MRRIAVFVGAFSAGSLAHAQVAPAPPPPAPPSASNQDREIVVVASPEQRTSIDRDTYIVRDTAEARTSNALEILSRIPAVSVQPDESVRLLGRSGVTILIDGRPTPNPNVLRDLHGAEIARIELISNPGAQFAASGTGGIINIVTRRNFLNGLRGSFNASASRYGGFELGASPSWTHGAWTVSGNFTRARYESPRSQVRERDALDPADARFDSREDERSRSRTDVLGGNVQISYHASEKQTITLQGGLFGAEGRTLGDSQIVLAADPGATLTERSASRLDYRGYNASLEYRRQGGARDDMLTASLQQYRFRVGTETDLTTESGAAVGLFRFESDLLNRARLFKVDYVHPLRAGARLLLGGSVNDTRNVNALAQSGDLPLGGNPFPPASRIDGSRLEMAAYASYQFRMLGGTLLAGLRIERRNYDFADKALGEGPSDAHLFPSLHFERPIARWLTGDLSYSRRIAWPDIADLSPVLRFANATSASIGNPALRPELTDSYEAKLRAQVARQILLLTLYSRHTGDLFSSLASLNAAGVLVTQQINLGARTDRGASLALQGPIVRGLSYSLNANLADRSIRQEGFDLRNVRPRAAYDATAQLDYRDGAEGRRGADHVTLTARYFGPSDDGLVRSSPYFFASASWSHAITDRLSTVLSADGLTGTVRFRSASFSDTVVSRQTTSIAAPRVKLALTYSLGTPDRHSAPPPPPVSVPGAGG